MVDWEDRLGSEIRLRAEDVLSSVGGSLKRLLRQENMTDEELAASYRESFTRRMKGERSGLAGHTSAFIGVNAVITGIWAMTGAGFPWFIIPILGWGIGYVSHRTAVRAREAEYREVMAADQPSRRQLRLHRDLWKVRRKWRGHVASNGMVMALLLTINAITGGIGTFPWALIPSGFLAVGIFTHYGRFRYREKELLQELSETGFRLTDVSAGSSSYGFLRRSGSDGLQTRSPHLKGGDPVKRAKGLRGAILSDVKKHPEIADTLGADLPAVLDRYVSQIDRLTQTYREVGSLIDSIPEDDFKKNRWEVERQVASTSDQRLVSEYRRHLEQIDQQLKSHEELVGEREILRLRIDGALQALQQLKIDVARTRSTRAGEADATYAELRTRSREISQYLEDLRGAWDEIS